MENKEAYLAWRLVEALDELAALVYEIYREQIIELWDDSEQEDRPHQHCGHGDPSKQIDPFQGHNPLQT